MHGLRSPRTRGWSRLGAHRRGAGGAFPAYAGVVPGRGGWGRSGGRVPRVRGGGPCWATKIAAWTSRSPRTRGWSRPATTPVTRSAAFPAYAGVVPPAPWRRRCRRRVPRVRGGGPDKVGKMERHMTRSPRTRGWSRQGRQDGAAHDAFPAYAVVVPSDPRCGWRCRGVPRVRGGGPVRQARLRASSWRSPRTRGWSQVAAVDAGAVDAFPAYAGVVRRRGPTPTVGRRVPRVRGGGPLLGLLGLVAVARSPRTRGWSRRAGRAAGCAAAFPAYAGVVPARAMVRRAIRSVPRVRGGGPYAVDHWDELSTRSPRTRGWSQWAAVLPVLRAAFPAYAGVVPPPTQRRNPRSSVPRVRGGGPAPARRRRQPRPRSPRTRGWSRQRPPPWAPPGAFPAYAGVVPPCASSGGRSWSVPRVREGGPATSRRICTARSRSPRTRGWSPDLIPTTHHGPEFNAYAGVVPSSWCPRWPRARVPRVRGGGPGIALRPGGRPSRSPRTRGWSLDGFWNTEVDACVPRVRGGGPVCWPSGGPLTTRSPRTRGWSLQQCDRLSHGNAFPAYAGVVPASVGHRLRSSGVPRVRGGGPMIRSSRTVAGTRSPRTRGWSRHRPERGCPAGAFPAYAGVVP